MSLSTLIVPYLLDTGVQIWNAIEVNSLTANTEFKYPTNTFYPPGVMCAKEFQRYFCPTSGESGSTLMVDINPKIHRYKKFAAQGFLSFMKGCNDFFFGLTNPIRESYILYQNSDNPAVYTKLSCFLPWIASQYNLEFTSSTETNPACVKGSGDITDVSDPTDSNSNIICRSNPLFILLSDVSQAQAYFLTIWMVGSLRVTVCDLMLKHSHIPYLHA